jgi:hypothetical protein
VGSVLPAAATAVEVDLIWHLLHSGAAATDALRA